MKFMVINGHDADKLPVDIRGNSICVCDEYVYLGAVFTSDGSLKSSIAKHAEDKAKHMHTLIMFLNTNRDFPFCVKRKVVEAAYVLRPAGGHAFLVTAGCVHAVRSRTRSTC